MLQNVKFYRKPPQPLCLRVLHFTKLNSQSPNIRIPHQRKRKPLTSPTSSLHKNFLLTISNLVGLEPGILKVDGSMEDPHFKYRIEVIYGPTNLVHFKTEVQNGCGTTQIIVQLVSCTKKKRNEIVVHEKVGHLNHTPPNTVGMINGIDLTYCSGSLRRYRAGLAFLTLHVQASTVTMVLAFVAIVVVPLAAVEDERV